MPDSTPARGWSRIDLVLIGAAAIVAAASLSGLLALGRGATASQLHPSTSAPPPVRDSLGVAWRRRRGGHEPGPDLHPTPPGRAADRPLDHPGRDRNRDAPASCRRAGARRRWPPPPRPPRRLHRRARPP